MQPEMLLFRMDFEVVDVVNKLKLKLYLRLSLKNNDLSRRK